MLDKKKWVEDLLAGKQPSWPDNDVDNFSNRLWEFCLDQGIAALCIDKLKSPRYWSQMPIIYRQRWLVYIKNEIAVEMLHKHELVQLLDAFEKAGVHYLLLKGTPLAYTLYPDAYIRSRCDTDILFQKREDAETIWILLKQHGYTRPLTIKGDYVRHQFSCYKIKPSGASITLDIHWKINNHNYLASFFSFDELNRTSILVPALSSKARTLNLEHSLLLACIHRAAHARYGMKNRLIWLYDIHLICERLNGAQWDNINEITITKSLNSILLDGLEQAIVSFNTPVPDKIIEMLKVRSKIDYITEKIMNSKKLMIIANIKGIPGIKGRMKFIKENLFPESSYILDKYDTKKRSLLPVLYIRRLAGGIYKLLY